MNLNILSVKELFEDKELDDLKKALARDKVIMKAIIKIANKRKQSNYKTTTLTDFQHTNWPFERAFLDGKDAEIQWWINLFNKGE